MSEAQDLINYLRATADQQVFKFQQSVGLLNASPALGLVMRGYPEKPTAYTSPLIPFPTLPAPPAGTVVDASAMNAAVSDLINSLSGSWMKAYFPASFTDTALSRLLNNGISTAELDTIEAELRAALLSAVTTLRTQLDAAIAQSKANLDANIAGLQPKIDAALDAAASDAMDVAWARARDLAAREAARQELEAISDWAARGFTLPGGVLTAQAEISRQATLNASSAMAAEQAVQMAKHYLDIAKMAVDNWLKAAELQMQSEISAYKTSEELRLKTAALEMDGHKDRAKVGLDALGIEVDLQKFAGDASAKYRLGIHNAINGLVSAYADTARAGVDGRVKVADSQRAVISAMADYWRAAISAADVTQKGTLENREQEIKWSHAAANVEAGNVGNRVAAATAISNVYAKVAAMAMAGLNGVASISEQTA